MADYTLEDVDYDPFATKKAEVAAANPAEAPPGQGADVLAKRNKAAQELDALRSGIPIAEQNVPNPLMRFGMAYSNDVLEPFRGAAEKAQLAFPGDSAGALSTLAQVAADRAARRQGQRELTATPAGQAGAFAGEALKTLLARPTAGAQALLGAGLGFLGGGPDKPAGLGNELLGSTETGFEAGATTWPLMKGAELLGTGINAARGNYTPRGAKMMATDQGAQRLGLTGPNALSIGQLEGNPSTRGQVQNQADALRQALDTTTQAPADMGTGTQTMAQPGGALRQELKDAVDRQYGLARDKYRAVDQLVNQGTAQPLQPMYTARTAMNINHPGYDYASDLLKRYDWDITAPTNLTPAQAGRTAIPFDEYGNMRVATNKAWGTVNRQIETAQRMGNAPSAEQIQARNYLTDLRTALDSDAERWANQNSGNRDALDAFQQANDYYRQVVAPRVINNPLARTAASRTKSWPTAQTMYSAVERNPELTDRLTNTLSPTGRAMIDVLQNIPDVATAVTSGRLPNTPESLSPAGLLAFVRHPLATLEAGTAPGLGWAARSDLLKRLRAAQSGLSGPSGTATAALLQYPQDKLQGAVQRTLGLP